MKNRIIILAIILISLSSQEVFAQCAMCKATIEGNPDATHIAKGLNNGILYLAAIPYLLFSVVGYYWYKHSKKVGKSKLSNQVR